MYRRDIELLNHYSENEMVQENDNSMGDFQLSSFGYFDAVRIGESKVESEKALWDIECERAIEEIDGSFIIRHIGLHYDDKYKHKEKEFWEKSEKYPYCFYVMMWIKDISKVRKEIIVQNKQENVMVYLTFEHVEAIAVCKTSKYEEGILQIHKLKKAFRAQRTYSIFTVEEEYLKNQDFWKERVPEHVEVRLSATMRDREKAQEFFYKLKGILREKEKNVRMDMYDEIGEEDLTIEIHDIDLNNILPLYAMGRLLTHSNKEYNEAFFNIKTKFAIRGRYDGREAN